MIAFTGIRPPATSCAPRAEAVANGAAHVFS